MNHVTWISTVEAQSFCLLSHSVKINLTQKICKGIFCSSCFPWVTTSNFCLTSLASGQCSNTLQTVQLISLKLCVYIYILKTDCDRSPVNLSGRGTRQVVSLRGKDWAKSLSHWRWKADLKVERQTKSKTYTKGKVKHQVELKQGANRNVKGKMHNSHVKVTKQGLNQNKKSQQVSERQ